MIWVLIIFWASGVYQGDAAMQVSGFKSKAACVAQAIAIRHRSEVRDVFCVQVS